MRIRIMTLITVLLSLLCLPNAVLAEKEKFPPRLQAVQDYLLKKEYPELIDDKPYRIRLTGFDIGDLDGDGVDEVVVSFYPHFLQSPTVVIFKVDNKMKVKRVTEGLAPGPIIPVTGEYLDSHSSGHGIDMSLENKAMADPEKRRSFIKTSLNNMGNVVAYKNFLHMDGRKGKGMYIDMQHIKKPPKDKTCASIQFSRIARIQIGRKKGEKAGTIIALAGDKVYFYKINKIGLDGMLDKSLKVVPMSEGKK